MSEDLIQAPAETDKPSGDHLGSEKKPMPYPIILCGDHAEFEMQHANTNPEDRPDWPLPSFDARDWAKAFLDAYEKDPGDDFLTEGNMIGWFANALMRGHDEAARSQGDRTALDLDGRSLETNSCATLACKPIAQQSLLSGDHPVSEFEAKAKRIMAEACLGEEYARNGVIKAMTESIATALAEAVAGETERCAAIMDARRKEYEAFAADPEVGDELDMLATAGIYRGAAYSIRSRGDVK